MPDFFSTILGKFDLLVKNIGNIKSHMALFLLRHCLWIPKTIFFVAVLFGNSKIIVKLLMKKFNEPWKKV
jgi:hypothetical protein